MAAAEQFITSNLDVWSSAVQMKSAAGRGKGNKLELYGVKKLRELILELAVRGLLVPQDPNDEPASELLKNIAAEKAQLVKDKKIKKLKALTAIEVGERPFELPEGWEWAKLGDLLDRISNGFSGKQDKSGVGLPITRIETISESKVNLEKVGYSNSIPEEKQDYFRLDQGDILLSHINSDYHVGKTALFESGKDLYHGVNLLLLRPSKLVCPRYIDLSINQLRLSGYFLSIAQHAIGQSSINQKKVLETLVTVPPLAEENRIIAKVDELMALCDQLEQQQGTSIAAHQTLVQTLLDALTMASERDGFTAAWARIADHFDTLFTTEWSIDQLKQTILQLAVMGKLVPQDPNDDPASELLKKIAAEKAQLVKDGKINKPKALAPIKEDEKPHNLPSSWAWVRFGQVAVIERGGSPRPIKSFITDDPDGLNWIKIGDTDQGGKYITSTQEKIRKEGLVKTRMVHPGDFLLTNSMSFGRPYITKIEGCIHDGWLRISPPSTIDKDFLYLLLSSPYIFKAFQASAAGAVVMNLNADKVREVVILVPPLAEQHRIVAKVDELMALCDTLKTRLNTAQTTQLQLADAMAEQAVA